MKKVIAVFAIMMLASCGGASTEVKTDSVAAQVDSNATVAVDSNVAKIAADSAK